MIETNVSSNNQECKGRISAKITFFISIFFLFHRFILTYFIPLNNPTFFYVWGTLLQIVIVSGVVVGVFSLVRINKIHSRKYVLMAIFGFSVNSYFFGVAVYHMRNLWGNSHLLP